MGAKLRVGWKDKARTFHSAPLPPQHTAAAAAAKSLQSCLTLRPPRRQPTRLRHTWDSPQHTVVTKSQLLFYSLPFLWPLFPLPSANVLPSMSAEWHLSLCNSLDCSQPGSSVHRISQARILDWVAISSSRDLCTPGIKPASPEFPALAGGFFTT